MSLKTSAISPISFLLVSRLYVIRYKLTAFTHRAGVLMPEFQLLDFVICVTLTDIAEE
jgi:hypothetical protein